MSARRDGDAPDQRCPTDQRPAAGGHHRVDLDDIRSIWYRDPTAFDFPANLSAPERRFAFREARLGLAGVLASLDTLWVNHPNRASDAIYKPLQLTTAARSGLAVPRTLVTNDAAAVRRFHAESRPELICKVLGANAITEDGTIKVTYTHKLDDGDLDNVNSTAHQFQDWVDKHHEVRVVVVGDRIFPVGIHAGSAASRIDWRTDYAALRYELVEAPLVVADGIAPGTEGWTSANTADDLDLIYSNKALFVLPDGLSSTSMPALMTRMLEALDVHDGHQVLEIGTGTGYNAALLSHRLGDQHVFSVDIEPTLIRLAAERLAAIGYQPTLAAVDGADGFPVHAPYDRVIATCSVPAVPWPWIEQTRDGGLILADVKVAQLAGNLVLLRRIADGAHGRFDRTYGGFMAMRRSGDTYDTPPRTGQDRAAARARESTLDVPRPWQHSVLWFLASFRLGPGITFGLRGTDTSGPPTTAFLAAPDGSWCEAEQPTPDGTRRVWEAGPRPLWRILEDAHTTWCDRGQPGWERFGLTVTASAQTIWLDESRNVVYQLTETSALR